MKGKAQPVSLPPVIGNTDEQKNASRIFTKETTLSINTTEEGSIVYYTLDGTDPGISSTIYSAPISITRSCEVKAVSFVKGKVSSNVVTFNLRKAKYEINLLTEASARYSASGPRTLVDGTYGSLKFTDGKWLGFEGDDFEAVIDLGAVKPISEIVASFLQSYNSWIFLPLSVELYISDDNKNYTPAGIVFGTVPLTYESDKFASFAIKTGKPARFVKIKAKNTGICPEWHKGKNGKAWLFVDEIEVK